MAPEYRPTRTERGLDLEAHDVSLGVLGSLYEQQRRLDVPESPHTVAALGCALHGSGQGR